MARKKGVKLRDEDLMSLSSLGKYANKWVAIVDGEVVASGNDGEAVFLEANKKYPDRKIKLMKVPSNPAMLL